jgi:hypothetical protein
MQYIGSILAFGRHPRPRIGERIEICRRSFSLSLLSLSLSPDYWVCIDRISIIIRPPNTIEHPASGPPSLLSLLSTPPCLSPLSPFALSVLIVAFPLSLPSLFISAPPFRPSNYSIRIATMTTMATAVNDSREGGAVSDGGPSVHHRLHLHSPRRDESIVL